MGAGKVQVDDGAFARLGMKMQSGVHAGGTSAQVAQALTGGGLGGVEANAIVHDLDVQPFLRGREMKTYAGGLGMTRDVVQDFLAEQVQLAPGFNVGLKHQGGAGQRAIELDAAQQTLGERLQHIDPVLPVLRLARTPRVRSRPCPPVRTPKSSPPARPWNK